MAQTIPQQLAAHIDETCGVHNTGVSQFFDEDGNLRACKPGESVFAFSIACTLVIYEPDEHEDYLVNVWNMIEEDINELNKIQKTIAMFKMPEPQFSVGMKVYWTDPDDGVCSGVFIIEEIRGEVYRLGNEVGSDIEASYDELSEVKA